MNKFFISILTACLTGICAIMTAKAEEKTTINVFDHVVFYDGYQQDVVDADVKDGVYRIKNSLYSVKLNPEDFRGMRNDLTLNVKIGALCDNYDRMGAVYLVFAPKGTETYTFDEVKRIEIARLITPFMNKTVNPTEVPYSYDMPNVAKLIGDSNIGKEFDLWVEFEVFGVPYAAQAQVTGCKNRNDVFEGTLDFEFTPTLTEVVESGNVMVPVYVKQPEEMGNVNFNNYTECATDTLGVTTRTFEFEIPEDVSDSKIYLILTNHGANSGGEEYVRRLHHVYYDGNIMLSYTPGGESCEPYRQYNTQPNGIYSTSRPESFWKTQSNWCPGQAVPIREIDLGAQKAGTHKVMIRVPDARFIGKDGDFKPSLYFHGVKSGQLPASADQIWLEGPEVTITKDGTCLNILSDEPILSLIIHTVDGKLADVISHPGNRIDLSEYPHGMLILTFVTDDGRTTAKQVL